jgi:hypothetical protein
MRVAVNDRITTQMKQSSDGVYGHVVDPSWTGWTVSAKNTRTNQTTSSTFYITKTNVPRRAYRGAVEAYYVTSCTQFPASRSILFDRISVYTSGPSWFNQTPYTGPWYDYYPTGTSQKPVCGYGVWHPGGELYFSF